MHNSHTAIFKRMTTKSVSVTIALESPESHWISIHLNSMLQVLFASALAHRSSMTLEFSMLNHLYASAYNFDTDDLDWLKEHCRQEVASLNGRINLTDIAEEYVEG